MVNNRMIYNRFSLFNCRSYLIYNFEKNDETFFEFLEHFCLNQYGIFILENFNKLIILKNLNFSLISLTFTANLITKIGSGV